MNLLLDVVNQLVAVLRLGTRGSRYSAARALEGIFISMANSSVIDGLIT